MDMIVSMKTAPMVCSRASLASSESRWSSSPPDTTPFFTCYPCVAVVYSGETFQSTLLKNGDIVREIELIPGSHAFVKVSGESFLRMSPLSLKFGEACGHQQLGGDNLVEYAGCA